MKIKTSRDLVPPLRGSAFRRVSCDGRCWFLRHIRTHRTQKLQARRRTT